MLVNINIKTNKHYYYVNFSLKHVLSYIKIDMIRALTTKATLYINIDTEN